MESGKSWFAAGCVAAELTKGKHVVYVHFEESDATDTIERLKALGSVETIRARFRFVGPEERVTAEALAALLTPAPSLVVFDGVNEAMSLHGWKDDGEGAATYRRHLVKPCTKAGAAALSCDHVPKDKTVRGREAFGSVHKGNGLTGVLILLENVEAFGRSRSGASKVFTTKDRPGYLRQHGQESGLPGKTYMGMLKVDDTKKWHEYLDLALLAPKEKPEGEGAEPVSRDDADDAKVRAAIERLEAKDQKPTRRKIEAITGISKERTGNALVRLVLRPDGGVTVTEEGQAHIYATVPVPVPEDHSSSPDQGDS